MLNIFCPESHKVTKPSAHTGRSLIAGQLLLFWRGRSIGRVTVEAGSWGIRVAEMAVTPLGVSTLWGLLQGRLLNHEGVSPAVT